MLADRIQSDGRACVVVCNKWDLVEDKNDATYNKVGPRPVPSRRARAAVCTRMACDPVALFSVGCPPRATPAIDLSRFAGRKENGPARSIWQESLGPSQGGMG